MRYKNHFEIEYNKLHWKKWKYRSGRFVSLRHANPPIPPRHGVYLFRAPHRIARVQGFSDVFYIGQSGGGKRGGKQGIGPRKNSPGRLFNTRGPDKWVRERIEELYPDEFFYVECAFIDNCDTREIEEALQRAYLQTHFELPSANHQSVKME